MRRKLSTLLLLALAAFSMLAFAGCGEEEEENHAVEGEPLELGDLSYNVQITRFLNPSNEDDATYLEGLPEAPLGQEYLAVFLRIENEGEELETIPYRFEITNIREISVEPIDVDNPFAVEFGAQIEPEHDYPAPNSLARLGPIKGSMLLFLVDQDDTENRPLELVIPSAEGESGHIELDI